MKFPPQQILHTCNEIKLILKSWDAHTACILAHSNQQCIWIRRLILLGAICMDNKLLLSLC